MIIQIADAPAAILFIKHSEIPESVMLDSFSRLKYCQLRLFRVIQREDRRPAEYIIVKMSKEMEINMVHELRRESGEEKRQILKRYFGYDTFRSGQETLIDSILEGRDTLGIMPTGAGKSICYQVPALLMDGITLVISPLISLMKDQVESLNQAGIHAAYLNSSLTASQYYKALQYAREGRYPIIYVAPERLMTEEFLNFACGAKIAMVAVDEAHCVSQWGQDFRPSYLKIVEFIERLPVRPVVSAFTATATAQVRDDIIDILMLQNPVVLTTGFDRKNLYFGVMTPKDRYGAIRNYLETHREHSGIIYCLTRKVVEEVCEKLQKDGFSVTRYHAGLSDGERKKNQKDFIYDRAAIMVATNAFGMGIDKSNVRFVLHYGMPKNLESYYQEAGRAGRDGEPAECILYYNGQDVVTNQVFIDHNQDNQELDAVTRAMVQERDRERLKKMTFYCFTNECLRDYILRYFGEYGGNYCGNCSNCLSQFETVDVTEIARALIGCVDSCRQRYGMTVIIDTVHGANTAKIRQYRMEQNPFYGTLAKVPAYRLRQVLNYLMLNEYLRTTNDEYMLVKLDKKAQSVLDGEETIQMKLAREQERMPKAEKEKAGRKRNRQTAGGMELDEREETLFEELRVLRTEIAREEKVPPYIVFSDKSLIHMAVKRPQNKREMLAVSGVGEFKFEKYGERFLACVKGWMEKQGTGGGEAAAERLQESQGMEDVLYFTSDDEDMEDWNLETALAAWDGEYMESAGEGTKEGAKGNTKERLKEETENSKTVKKKRPKKGKSEFFMSEELAEQLHYSPRVSLSDFVGQINDLRDEEAMKRLTIKSVEKKLMDEGYLEIRFFNGISMKYLPEKGMDFGITAEKRMSEKGNEYEVFFYTEKAQREMVKWLLQGEC